MKATKRTGVYLWRCISNGKIYVGSTTGTFQQRFWNHRLDLRKGKHCNRHLQRAWNKYGEQNFEWVEVEVCTPEMCLDREQHWLDHYKSYDREFGYNLAAIAGSHLGLKHTQETKDKKSKSMKAVWARKTKEELVEHGRKVQEAWSHMSQEERDKYLEKRSEQAKEMWNQKSKEQKDLDISRLRQVWQEFNENQTPEEKATRYEKASKSYQATVAARTQEEKKQASIRASQAAVALWSNMTEEERQAFLSKRNEIYRSQEHRKKMSGHTNTMWADPEQRARRIAAIREGKRKKRKKKLQEQLWAD